MLFKIGVLFIPLSSELPHVEEAVTALSLHTETDSSVFGGGEHRKHK